MNTDIIREKFFDKVWNMIYDEMKMLEISSGRCSQDHLYIKELDCLPEFVKKRKQHNLIDCVLSEKNTVVCIFKDGTVKKIALDQLTEVDGVDKVMKNTALFESGEVGTDGYCLTFNHSIDVPAKKLYEIEEALPIKKTDFVTDQNGGKRKSVFKGRCAEK